MAVEALGSQTSRVVAARRQSYRHMLANGRLDLSSSLVVCM